MQTQKETVCAFFVGGRCSFGNACRNLHPPRSSRSASPSQPKVCPHFLKGTCTFGSKCRLPHPANGTTTNATVAAAPSSICPYFLKGACRFGQDCTSPHTSEAKSKSKSKPKSNSNSNSKPTKSNSDTKATTKATSNAKSKKQNPTDRVIDVNEPTVAQSQSREKDNGGWGAANDGWGAWDDSAVAASSSKVDDEWGEGHHADAGDTNEDDVQGAHEPVTNTSDPDAPAHLEDASPSASGRDQDEDDPKTDRESTQREEENAHPTSHKATSPSPSSSSDASTGTTTPPPPHHSSPDASASASDHADSSSPSEECDAQQQDVQDPTTRIVDNSTDPWASSDSSSSGSSDSADSPDIPNSNLKDDAPITHDDTAAATGWEDDDPPSNSPVQELGDWTNEPEQEQEDTLTLNQTTPDMDILVDGNSDGAADPAAPLPSSPAPLPAPPTPQVARDGDEREDEGNESKSVSPANSGSGSGESGSDSHSVEEEEEREGEQEPSQEEEEVDNNANDELETPPSKSVSPDNSGSGDSKSGSPSAEEGEEEEGGQEASQEEEEAAPDNDGDEDEDMQEQEQEQDIVEDADDIQAPDPNPTHSNLIPPPEASYTICKYFAQGKCTRGNTCFYKHVSPASFDGGPASGSSPIPAHAHSNHNHNHNAASASTSQYPTPTTVYPYPPGPQGPVIFYNVGPCGHDPYCLHIHGTPPPMHYVGPFAGTGGGGGGAGYPDSYPYSNGGAGGSGSGGVPPPPPPGQHGQSSSNPNNNPTSNWTSYSYNHPPYPGPGGGEGSSSGRNDVPWSLNSNSNRYPRYQGDRDRDRGFNNNSNNGRYGGYSDRGYNDRAYNNDRFDERDRGGGGGGGYNDRYGYGGRGGNRWGQGRQGSHAGEEGDTNTRRDAGLGGDANEGQAQEQEQEQNNQPVEDDGWPEAIQASGEGGGAEIEAKQARDDSGWPPNDGWGGDDGWPPATAVEDSQPPPNAVNDDVPQAQAQAHEEGHKNTLQEDDGWPSADTTAWDDTTQASAPPSSSSDEVHVQDLGKAKEEYLSTTTWPNSSQGVCAYYKRGDCRKGEKCKFLHDKRVGDGSSAVGPTTTTTTGTATPSASTGAGKELNSQSKAKPCKWFKKGDCKKGKDCPFSHGKSSEAIGVLPSPSTPAGKADSRSVSPDVTEGHPIPGEDGEVVNGDAVHSNEHSLTRHLFGSIVEFGSEAEVVDITTPSESKVLKLSGLPEVTSEGDVQDLVSRFGDTRKVDFVEDGIARVEFSSRAAAALAAQELDNTEVQSRTLNTSLETRSRTLPLSDTPPLSSAILITWKPPTMIAFANYPTVAAAKKAETALDGKEHRGRKLVAKYSRPHKSERSNFAVCLTDVTLGAGLTLDTEALKELCGASCTSITEGLPTYRASPVEAIRRDLREAGPLEEFDVLQPNIQDASSSPSIPSFPDISAFAVFGDASSASQACKKLKNLPREYLGKNPLTAIRQIHLRQYRVPTPLFKFVKEGVDGLVQSLYDCELRYQEQHDGMTAIYVCGSLAQATSVDRARISLKTVLDGETLLTGERPFWSPVFEAAIGDNVIATLTQDASYHVWVDQDTQALHLYGDVKQAKKTLKDLLRPHKINIPSRVSFRAVTNLLGDVREQGVVLLNTAKRHLNIIIPSADGPQITANVATEVAALTPQTSLNFGCSFCLSPPPTDLRVDLRCGHSYCRDCMVLLLLPPYQMDFELPRCVAEMVVSTNSEETSTCGAYIPFYIIESILPQEQLDQLLRTSAFSYARGGTCQESKELAFCPSLGCSTIYRRGDGKPIFQCPQCLVWICPSCCADHSGVTCEEYLANVKLITEASSS